MRAHELAKVEEACVKAWNLATDKSAREVTGVSIRIAEGDALFEVVLDKQFNLTCKRYS